MGYSREKKINKIRKGEILKTMNTKKFKELKIDNELRDLLPPLTKEELETLEQNLLKDGCTSPIFTWNGYIVDGHNRYGICEKHNIEFEEIKLAYESKDDIIQWVIENQLGRRNLTDVQRIIVAEKYRNIIERKAKDNLIKSGLRVKIEKPIDTKKELAKIAKVSTDTYWKGKKILESDNDEVKQKAISGELKVNTAYNIIFQKNKSRKPISPIVLKHLIIRSQGKCEICNWGGEGLEGVLIPHHIHKYCNTKDNSSKNLAMLCPNCHTIIHTLENCKDDLIKNNILKNIDKEVSTKINTYLKEIQ